MKTPLTSDMNLNDTTLLNTNHNSNYFNQSTFVSTGSNQILRPNGTSFTLDNLETRGVNALHRRAEQLKRWQEAEDEYEIKKQAKQLDSRNHVNLINKANLIFKKRDDDNRKIKFSNSTLFLAACASADYDEINRLLNNNLVDINVGNIDGLTALHHACIDDKPELVEFLLKNGADVNCVDNEGWSPLHATASCDHIEIARLLLLYGADCTLVNVDHELPLDLAEDDEMHKLLEDALYEQEKITDIDKLRRQEEEKMREDVLEMIKTGIYDNKIHKRTGATIIHVAACKGYLDVLQLLFENKVLKNQIDINVKDVEGWTPLTAAAYWNKPLVVELLLQNGADVNCVTNNNQTLEQMTDYDLILNLIATRREQLQKQETQRLQEENKENGNLNKSNAESETQRKAHAKRIRESRRSTQGISAEDVNKAKDQLLLNSAINSTIINLTGDSNCPQVAKLATETSNKVEITKLETINEICKSANGESNPSQSYITAQVSPSLQKTSLNDHCQIVEVKSVLDYVDGQRAKREFIRPYRPKITIDENEVNQEVNATINLNANENFRNDKDELKNDAVLNLRRDSLNILQQLKDTKKSVALNHSKDNASLVRVERFDDYQAPKISALAPKKSNNILVNELNEELNNLEKTLDYTVRRNISQDSLDEQTNGNQNDYIGINSTLNASQAVSYPIINAATKAQQPNDYLIEDFQESNKNAINIRSIDNPYIDRQYDPIDRHVDKELKQSHLNENVYRSTIGNYLPPLRSSNQTAAVKQFEVPVLIETPCTPEPPVDDECSTAESETATLTNSSFENDSEQNLAKRKRNKRRIENQEEIDILFNETMNTINPKYTRNIDSTAFNKDKNSYLYNKPNMNQLSGAVKSNGNSLKLYKKDEDVKLPNSSVVRSRPSSTSSTTSQATNYKNKDNSDKLDHNVNNDNLGDKSNADDSRTLNQPLVNQSVINQQTINNQKSTREHKAELDYKKMYEDLLVEFENFKAEVNKKEQDYLREKRKMERKISELEEESVQMETVKEENIRLKNENGALVRVISKLSK